MLSVLEGIPIAYYNSAERILEEISSIFEESTLSSPDSYIPQSWNQKIWGALWRVRDFEICQSHSSSLEILAQNAKTVDRSSCASTILHEEKPDVDHETISNLSYATKVDILANSIDPDSKNNSGQTLLDATMNGRQAVVKRLSATEGIDPNYIRRSRRRERIAWSLVLLRCMQIVRAEAGQPSCPVFC